MPSCLGKGLQEMLLPFSSPSFPRVVIPYTYLFVAYVVFLSHRIRVMWCGIVPSVRVLMLGYPTGKDGR